MKSFSIIAIFSCIFHWQVAGQYTISADTLSGCDSLRVIFTISPDPADDGINVSQWNFGIVSEINVGSSISHQFDTPGVFNVSVLLSNGLTLELTEPVRVYPSPQTQFTYRDSLEAVSYSFLFSAPSQEPDSLDYAYTWDFGDGNGAAGSLVFHTFEEKGDYSVLLRIESETGCSSTAVQIVRARDLFRIPNVFTPNEDGKNDFFRVNSNGVDVFELSIYSRSGLLVYRSEAPLIEWDGRSFSGSKVRPGVYYFVIRQLSGDDEIHERGFIHLLD